MLTARTFKAAHAALSAQLAAMYVHDPDYEALAREVEALVPALAVPDDAPVYVGLEADRTERSGYLNVGTFEGEEGAPGWFESSLNPDELEDGDVQVAPTAIWLS